MAERDFTEQQRLRLLCLSREKANARARLCWPAENDRERALLAQRETGVEYRRYVGEDHGRC